MIIRIMDVDINAFRKLVKQGFKSYGEASYKDTTVDIGLTDKCDIRTGSHNEAIWIMTPDKGIYHLNRSDYRSVTIS